MPGLTAPTMSASDASIRLISLACFTSMAAMRVCDSMLVTLAQAFAVSTGEASQVVAAFALGYGALQLFIGALGDRSRKLRVIAIASLACAVIFALTALATSLTWLVACRALLGAAAAGVIPLSMAWIGDSFDYVQRQARLARLMMATVSGMMIGQWFGGFAADHLGWQAAFVVLAALFFIAACLLLRHPIGPRPPQPTMSYLGGLLNTLRLLGRPRVRWIMAFALAEGALGYGSIAFMPSHLVAGLGVSGSMAGAVMVMFGLGGLLYSYWATRWLHTLGERGLALAGGALIALGLCLLVVAAHWAVAALACVTTGLGFYMLHNTLQTQATQMAPDYRGSAVSLFGCALFFGQSLGIAALAPTVDQGQLSAGFVVAGVGALVLGLTVSRKVRPRGS